jgi:hypothetical protein
MQFSNIFTYFRDCYEADNARATIWNIFHGNVEHRIFVEDEEELLTGLLPYIPIDHDKGIAAKTAAYLHRKEKELVYCSLFVSGWLTVREEQPQAICSPLLIHPAELIESNGNVLLKPDLVPPRLNYLLLDNLQVSESKHLSEQLGERLGADCGGNNFVPAIANLLETSVPGLNASDLFQYPKLMPEREIREIYSSVCDDPKARLRVLPGSAAALVKKSVETRGVLNELLEISQADSLSAPAQTLLGGKPAGPGSTGRPVTGPVPAILSVPQQRVLQSAARSPLTLVIGPPGTGKSYTIAAIAIEHLGRGQNVLIASKMNHAVDVVAQKIEQQLGITACIIRGGRKEYLRDLKGYIEQLLMGPGPSPATNEEILARSNRRLRQLDREVRRLEDAIAQYSGKEISWGNYLATEPSGAISRLKVSYIRWRINRSTPLWKLLEDLEGRLMMRIRETAAVIEARHNKRVAESLRLHRTDLVTFLKALRARTGGKQEDLFQKIDFRVLLTAFPVWLVNLSDVHDVLPLRRELFDLVIIDEATQCDIASCLPVVQRAARAVIVGDPKQLRHLSFLSIARQKALMETHGIPKDLEELFDYRSNSVLDLANDTITGQEQVVFLDEHFRSTPQIIGFSNKVFYAGGLHVMTEKPTSPTTGSLTLHRVNGRRRTSGENPEEVGRIVEDVVHQIESEKALGPGATHSIGILSPFRDQVDSISNQLTSSLAPEAFEKHNVLIGTAHTFQGEERDVMFLSFAVDPKSPAASIRFLEKQDVFNVSITRARVAQHVYVSLETSALGRESLLGSYLRYIAELGSTAPDGPRSDGRQPPRDTFLSEVMRELAVRGYKTWAAYSIGGLVVDIVAAKGDQSFGVDLIGFPGDFEAGLPLECYKMFYRAGLKVIPLPYARWRLDKDACLKAVDRIVGAKMAAPPPPDLEVK